VDRFSLNSRVLGNFILQFGKFHTQERLDEVSDFFPKRTTKYVLKRTYFLFIFLFLQMKSFFKRYPKAGAGETARKQALEMLSTNIKWMDWNSQKVTDWFKKRYE